jgi:hypothetical protein
LPGMGGVNGCGKQLAKQVLRIDRHKRAPGDFFVIRDAAIAAIEMRSTCGRGRAPSHI